MCVVAFEGDKWNESVVVFGESVMCQGLTTTIDAKTTTCGCMGDLVALENGGQTKIDALAEPS